MGRTAGWAVAAAGVFAPLAVLAAADQQVFRGRLDTVPVYATVTDKTGRLVTDLTKADFQLYDNGKIQELTSFDNSPQPIKLIVMLDVSGSMSGNVRLVQMACEQLFKQLRPDDGVKIGTFGEEIAISPTFTNDLVLLRAAVPTQISPNAPTPLWRAMDKALSSFGDVSGRRVILVLSDGKDSRGVMFGQKFMTVLDSIDRAQREDVMFYGIGLESRGMTNPMAGGAGMLGNDMPDPELPRLATETGGGYFEIHPRDDLGAAFARVADELHRQYLLGFVAPTADGKLHKLEVKVTKPDMKPRARKNYEAPKK
jgi:Ca-activated chloride channel homolog